MPSFIRNHMPDATPRVGNIAAPPRNHVYVQMEDRLASALANVHTYVEAIRGRKMLGGSPVQDRLPRNRCRLTELSTFLGGCFEPARNVSFGKQQSMTR